MVPIFGCMYCGVSNAKLTDEHVIPEALGGKTVLQKRVCAKCNNGILSELDKELVTQSPLSLVSFRDLHSGLGHTWDVDHLSGNILVEAEPVLDERGFESMMVWPQLILEGENLTLRANQTEITEFGVERFSKRLLQTARRAFRRHIHGEKSIIWERHREDEIAEGYFLPPRIYAKRRIIDFTMNQKMIISYVSDDDRRRLFRALDRLTSESTFSNHRIRMGSKRPIVQRPMFPDMVVRALMKIGLNVLALICDKTPVDRASFPHVIMYILGELRPRKLQMPKYGFIHPHEAEEIHRKDKGHSVKISYGEQTWTFQFSFFGGALAAIVQFPGLSSEDWKTAWVTMPLKQELVVERRTEFWTPIVGTVEWEDFGKMCPSLKPFMNGRINKFDKIQVKRKGPPQSKSA